MEWFSRKNIIILHNSCALLKNCDGSKGSFKNVKPVGATKKFHSWFSYHSLQNPDIKVCNGGLAIEGKEDDHGNQTIHGSLEYSYETDNGIDISASVYGNTTKDLDGDISSDRGFRVELSWK